MRYRIADDARPQIKLLLLATAITIALWFIPYAEFLVYPVRLFVTFIHESSHALVALLTGGAVHSLTVMPNGEGAVWSAPANWFSAALTASAGYLGATAFGVMLLVLLRRAFSAHTILLGSAGIIGVMTIIFGLIVPAINFLSGEVTFSSIGFTVAAGLGLTAVLALIARFASPKVANFTVAFLGVQCVLNALFDLKDLFLINAPLVGMNIQTDALNMSQATGLPAFAWVLIWIGVSVLMISIGLRVYAVGQKGKNHDLPFED